MRRLFFLAGLIFICSGAGFGGNSVFSVKGNKTFLNNHEFLVIGLRCSNALISDKTTNDLIDHLGEYKSYGVNTISVFFMGSRFGDVSGYREDGTLDPVYAKRMGRIIEACDKRGMVVLVGCLYWGTTKAKQAHWTQNEANRAIANTVKWLSDNNYRNVFVDPDNEGMAHREMGFDLGRMIAAGKAADPGIMIGFNSHGLPPDNADLALHFSDKPADKPYIQSEGTPPEYWGEYSKEKDLYNYINIGIYTPGKKEKQLKDTDYHLQNGMGYIFASTWLQCVPPNTSPGGKGTPGDPGIRWWLEHILSFTKKINSKLYKIPFMKKFVSALSVFLILSGISFHSPAQRKVLIIEDERPQMEVLSALLIKSGQNTDVQIVDQQNLPQDFSKYNSIILYIHKNLEEITENKVIDYTRNGGRLICLHHSISSGKAKNKNFFPFLGIQLDGTDNPRDAELPGAGYVWIEPVNLVVVNLNPQHPVTSNQIEWKEKMNYLPSDLPSGKKEYPSVTFPETEVYLNHKFTDGKEKTILLGIKFYDYRNDQLFMQDRAGWYKKSGKGDIFYFMPGHSSRDFENPVLSQMILNAINYAGN